MTDRRPEFIFASASIMNLVIVRMQFINPVCNWFYCTGSQHP